MKREHSYAYNDLAKMVKAVGWEKKDGYYSKTMEEIYDWERDEVEDIIWNKFQKDRDSDLSDFLPKLKKYDGMKALKKAMEEVYIPSPASVDMAKTLYNYTEDKKYLDIFRKNINYDNWDITSNLSTISTLTRCVVTENLYELFKELYFKCDDIKTTVGMVIIEGLLNCKGYTINFLSMDVEEIKKEYEMIKKFEVDSIEEKEYIIKKFENVELIPKENTETVLEKKEEVSNSEMEKSEK